MTPAIDFHKQLANQAVSLITCTFYSHRRTGTQRKAFTQEKNTRCSHSAPQPYCHVVSSSLVLLRDDNGQATEDALFIRNPRWLPAWWKGLFVSITQYH